MGDNCEIKCAIWNKVLLSNLKNCVKMFEGERQNIIIMIIHSPPLRLPCLLLKDCWEKNICNLVTAAIFFFFDRRLFFPPFKHYCSQYAKKISQTAYNSELHRIARKSLMFKSFSLSFDLVCYTIKKPAKNLV